MGSNIKIVTNAEFPTKEIARKSLAAACEIAKGAVINENQIGTKRPGDGCKPIYYWNIVNKKADKGFNKDDPL